ncbi:MULTISPECIES: hypothetical protein [Streptomyces]|uniref:hypothetical protein n=1 Tax=Streptomyces TaxID=1883 RepID=UPI00211A19D1|nr:hypothetical protein [Streptomyces hilarionis]MCQ9132262.1 hypothetical protein [Streptomyces hilarionis]
MYEMRPGPNQHGSAVVWHVTAKQAAFALCGQQLSERADITQDEQARHCPPCMDSFAQLVTSKAV